MKSLSIGFTVFIALCFFSSIASGKELVKEFKGSGDKATAEFEVEGPWIVDWRTRGDYPGQMAVEINLVSVPREEYLGKIVVTKYVDNGVKLFKEGGRYRFQVSASLASWTLRVEQLTRAEAETYTVKEKKKLRIN
jgi:hypothetical protein